VNYLFVPDMSCDFVVPYLYHGVTVAPARLFVPQSALRPASKAGPVCKVVHTHNGTVVSNNRTAGLVHV